jgi:hypothetical protein
VWSEVCTVFHHSADKDSEVSFLQQWVMNTVDSNLSATAGEQYRTMRAQLWAAVDDEISMNDCDIYR